MDAGLLAGTKAAKAKDPTSAPNVIWKAEHEAPRAVNVGAERIDELPDDAAQRLGFFHDRAHVLVSLGMGWKSYIGRGE